MPTTRERLAELTAQADAELAAELEANESEYDRATQALEAARTARLAGIARAIEEGWSHRRIAKTIGVSRGRISQMVMGDE
jgi:DNA-binding NarL/FixJ family response regulator